MMYIASILFWWFMVIRPDGQMEFLKSYVLYRSCKTEQERTASYLPIGYKITKCTEGEQA